MKKTILLTCFLSIFFQSKAQLFDRFVIGISPTYIIVDKLTNDFGYPYYLHELTTNINMAVNIKKNFRLGFQNLLIAGRSEEVKENYHVFGGFAQYRFLTEEKMQIYVESSYNFGNYCTCGFREPYRLDGLKYLGVGGGIDFKINNWLHLDFGFITYEILNKIENENSYTQYVIGADFQLFNK